MQNNRNKKHRIHAVIGGLFFCLLISSLLGSLPPTALSLVMQSNVIGSSGSITYPDARAPSNWLGHIGFEKFPVGTIIDSSSDIGYNWFDTIREKKWDDCAVSIENGPYMEIVDPSSEGIPSSPDGGDKCLKLWQPYGDDQDRRLYNMIRNVYGSLESTISSTKMVYFPSEFINGLGWSTFGGFAENDHVGNYPDGAYRYFSVYVNLEAGPLWLIRVHGLTFGGYACSARYRIGATSYSAHDLRVGGGVEGWDGSYSGYDGSPPWATVTINPKPIPVDRWFNYTTCLVRSTGTDGAFYLWIDGDLVFSITGVRTAYQKPSYENLERCFQLRCESGFYYVDNYYISDGPFYVIQ